ncbi:MAG: ribbon-helix-helix protein, CopG family [Desulfonatronovibrionaceae bacterium]
MTINLDDELQRALKETAVRQGQSVSKIIEESLRLRGIKSTETARQIVARVRQQAGLNEEEALKMGIEETQAYRSQ